MGAAKQLAISLLLVLLSSRACDGRFFKLEEGETILREEADYVEIAINPAAIDDEDSHMTSESMNGRSLYTRYEDAKSKSNLCKTTCIDKGLNFCAGQNYQSGVCCTELQACPSG